MLALHVLGVAATTAALLLGLWQWDAWQAGRAHEARDLAGTPARPLAEVMTADAPFPGEHVGRPVTFAGTWLPEGTVLVTDRDLDGRTGVWAVTPVAVCADAGTSCDPDADPAILVVRGWAPAASGVPAPPEGAVELTGWLQPGEGTGAPDPDPADDVLSELRIASAIQHVDQDLYGGYVVAEQAAPAGGLGDLEPVTPDSLPQPSTFTSLQNLLYAVEWWLFGAFALYVWWRWVRDDLERRRRGVDHADEDAEPAADTPEIASAP
jgi:cytochrome oxidase assembly protein ShyY1